MTDENTAATMVRSEASEAAKDEVLTDAPHYLARTLLANGIRNMYGVVGIPVTDFARIAQDMGMRFIAMRHEEDAVNAAAAEGFITSRPAIALTVSAPGFLNGLPALLEATVNGFPVIMIGGSSTRHVVDLDEGEYEGLDQMGYAKRFCKASFRVDRIEDIPLVVARAMHVASSGRPGAVYIDFPDDTVAQTLNGRQADDMLWTATDPAPAMPPARESIDAALTLLRQAKRPLMVVGKGAAIAHAEQEIREFVRKTDIPFQPMSMAKGVLPDTPQLDAVVRTRQAVEQPGEIHPNRHQSGRNRKRPQNRRSDRGRYPLRHDHARRRARRIPLQCAASVAGRAAWGRREERREVRGQGAFRAGADEPSSPTRAPTRWTIAATSST